MGKKSQKPNRFLFFPFFFAVMLTGTSHAQPNLVAPTPGHVGTNPGSCTAATENIGRALESFNRSCSTDGDCTIVYMHPDPCKPPIAISINQPADPKADQKFSEYRIWYIELCMKQSAGAMCTPAPAVARCINGRCEAEFMAPPPQPSPGGGQPGPSGAAGGPAR